MGQKRLLLMNLRALLDYANLGTLLLMSLNLTFNFPTRVFCFNLSRRPNSPAWLRWPSTTSTSGACLNTAEFERWRWMAVHLTERGQEQEIEYSPFSTSKTLESTMGVLCLLSVPYLDCSSFEEFWLQIQAWATRSQGRSSLGFLMLNCEDGQRWRSFQTFTALRLTLWLSHTPSSFWYGDRTSFTSYDT